MNKTLLELFSGTGSVGKVADVLGYSVISLDLKDAKTNADILEWDYTKLDPNEIDVIWASPPCIEYSIAKQAGIRKIEEANKIVLKTLEIIDYFKPKYWFIENPQTGLLKKQDFMTGLPYFDVDYCKYGMPYRKRTRIWTNVKTWAPRPLCKKDCGQMNGHRRKETAQRAPSNRKSSWPKHYTLFRQRDLYRIPTELIYEIFQSIEPIS